MCFYVILDDDARPLPKEWFRNKLTAVLHDAIKRLHAWIFRAVLYGIPCFARVSHCSLCGGPTSLRSVEQILAPFPRVIFSYSADAISKAYPCM